MSGLEEDKEIPRLHLPALSHRKMLKRKSSSSSSSILLPGGRACRRSAALFSQWRCIWGSPSTSSRSCFSGSPVVTTARPPKAVVPGWDDIASCGLLTSLDERKNLTFTEQAVEYAEFPSDEDGVKPDSKMFQGTWSYDAGTKRYSVTLDGEMTVYTLVSRGEPTTCILFMGELGAADLREAGSRFPAPMASPIMVMSLLKIVDNRYFVTDGVDVRNIRWRARRDRAELVGLTCNRWPKQPDGIGSDKQPDQAQYEDAHVPFPLERLMAE
jgi:hypothetical protein